MRGFLSWVTLDDAFTTQHGSPLKNADAFVAKQKDDPLVTPSVGVQGVYVASEETYAKAKEIADRRDVRLHTHLSETRGEVEGHRKRTGLRPVEWLEKIGFLGERVTAAHCAWVTMNEVRALARCGVSVAHCPVSNMKLASGGVAPVPEMLEAGVVVGLGTDSPISNNGMDVFADMKVAALLHKATRWDAKIMPAQTVFDLATIHAARAGMILASHRVALCRSAATFMSKKTSMPLFDIGESVPRPTTTPASSISGTGATPPLASFMLETGQWATLTPHRARARTSFIVTQVQCAAVTRSPRNPIFSSHSTGRS